MAEELQNLLDRIRKDGVEKAEAETAKILSAAKEKAQSIVKQAEAEAAASLEAAKRDAEAFSERGRKSLEQAARDVVLSVSAALNHTLQAIVSREVKAVLTEETLRDMVTKFVEIYCRAEARNSRAEIVVSEDDRPGLESFFMTRFADEIKRGVEIKSDGDVLAGFRVFVTDGHVEHDFTERAITDALCQLLRPQLAEITRKALNGK